MELAPGDVVCVPLGAREATGVVWAENPTPNPRLDNRLKDVEDKLDVPPLKPELRKFVDWVVELHARRRAAWCCACACAWASISAPRASASACGSPGRAPQRMTPARQRVLALLADGLLRAKGEAAEEAGVSAGVIDGLIDEGTLETLVLPPEPVARPPDPDFLAPDFTPAQRDGRRRAARHHRAGRLCGDAARRRHRLGQDRGLFRGGRRDRSRRGRQALILMPEIALTGAVPRPLRRALRRAAGRMAFAAHAAQARAHLGGGRGRRGERRRRRALGAVPALRRSRPDRRR